jgi:two-component system, OmpR family, sensor histidine kinase VicK
MSYLLMLAMSIASNEISRVTFFHLIFYSSWLKEKLISEKLHLTSPTSPPPPPNRKGIATTDDEADEKTEVVYGVENVIQKGLQELSNIKQKADLCAASDGPSVIVATKPMLNAYIEAKKRGVTIRYITEITKENISYCKEIMKFAEVRHLDKVKGHMGVSESQYGASAVAEEGERLTQLIHSNVKAFVEQQQYFFETLWEKAIPAEQRIREIEEGIPIEKTEVIYGPNNGIRVALECFARTKERMDSCCDSTMPSVVVTTIPIKNAGSQAIRRGVKSRVITEITKENIEYCREMIRIGHELRHLDNVKGNFSVGDRDYTANAAQSANAPLPQLIHSNVKAIIEQQQYFFETLWNKAIPAEQRIREIEEGVKPEVIETIRESKVTQERVFELIKSAKEEILIIFSTSNAFRRQEKAGAIDALIGLAKSKNVKIRILSPFDNYVRNVVDRIKREDSKVRIEIRNIEEPLQTKVSVLIVDRISLLSAELKNDLKETVLEAIGLATYSNSKPTVLSYASIFESLWNQTELYEHIRYLYEQLKSHDKMKQEFIDIAAHELRTPIQPILGLAQLLKEQISDSSQLEFLDVILRNAKRLQKLQEEMLDVTRIESGSIQIHKESFNLNELIFDVLQDFRTQLKDNPKIKLNYKSDGDVWVIADKNRIMQVISNLLTNAIKFTKAGRIIVQLRKKSDKKKKKIADSNNQVIVSIKDEGPGIDPLIMPRLFTKFASKSEKGTGLGLFISKSIIEAYDGKIWAENNIDGKGATFAFTLPIQKPHQQQQIRST